MKIYLVTKPDYDDREHIVAFSTKGALAAFIAHGPEGERGKIATEEVELDPAHPPGCFGVQLHEGHQARAFWSWTATPGTVYAIGVRGAEVYASSPEEALALAEETIAASKREFPDIQIAVAEGARAHRENRNISDNPYPQNTNAYNAFGHGWVYGETGRSAM